MKQPVRIAVTGAAGSISYTLLFKLAAGEMLGPDQPVILQLIELPVAMKALTGVAMELEDCAFPLLHGISVHDNAEDGFKGVQYAFLVGAKPRGPGMERADLLQENAKIFTGQGKALNDNASPDVKVLVVGNPANTNALIASRNAPDLSPTQFSAMTRLDHNRARGILANKVGLNASDVKGVIIWGNHSPTQYPDLSHATFAGNSINDQVDQAWYKDEYMPRVQKRGAEIIDARGLSSAASAAQSAIDHMRDWALGTPDGEYTSMAVISDGSYGIAKGIFYSFPVKCNYGRYAIVQGLDISDFSREKMSATESELLEEKSAVESMLPAETIAAHEQEHVNLQASGDLYDGAERTESQYLCADRII